MEKSPPPYVKVSTSVEMGDRFLVNTNCFWEVPELVLNRIETQAALAGRSALCDYSSENPWVAKRKGIAVLAVSAVLLILIVEL